MDIAEDWERINIPFDSRRVTIADLTNPGGYQATQRLLLLSLPHPPDAIICINDETAFGVLHAAREAGLQVGRNLAVAGFDGVQLSKYSEPPLTTLDIPVYDIACQLVRMLQYDLTGQPNPERTIVIQPKLLIRESTTWNFHLNPFLISPSKSPDSLNLLGAEFYFQYCETYKCAVIKAK